MPILTWPSPQQVQQEARDILIRDNRRPREPSLALRPSRAIRENRLILGASAPRSAVFGTRAGAACGPGFAFSLTEEEKGECREYRYSAHRCCWGSNTSSGRWTGSARFRATAIPPTTSSSSAI